MIKRIFFGLPILALLCISSMHCMRRKSTIIVKKDHIITRDSFYHLLDTVCAKVKNKPYSFYYDKSNARQYIMLYNTVFNYGSLLVLDKNDSNSCKCLDRNTLEEIGQKYENNLLTRKNYIIELNIYFPPSGDEMSYYQIVELSPLK